MELWTSFLLGLVGSLHCAGMCGPLALALPVIGHTRASFLAGRAVYNAGRILTYGVLGCGFGLLGQTLALAGLQRWLSLGAGGAILLGLLASSRGTLRLPLVRGVAGLKVRLAALLQRRTYGSLLTLGLLNGLLPCGLVYGACAAAAATGGIVAGTASMLTFGLGTVPMMLALGLAARPMNSVLRLRLQRLIPATVLCVGTLLVLRGLALGIPYLSPDLSPGACPCHGPAHP